MAVSPIKWQAGPVSRSTILTTELNAHPNNTMSAAGTAIVNTTNLDTLGELELKVTFVSAPTDAAPTVDVYFAKSLDGTNYSSAPVTGGVDCAQLFFVSIPVRKVTSAQVITVGPLLLPSGNWKPYVDNQTGVAFPATLSTLALYTENFEAK